MPFSCARERDNIRRLSSSFTKSEPDPFYLRNVTFPHYWGDEKRAAADGTQYELAEENLLAEQHIRYGGFGGIAYHHVSDMYIMLFTQFIACGMWEAVHILDGLIRNRSDVSPTTVHADMQGQNLPVFGLSFPINTNAHSYQFQL